MKKNENIFNCPYVQNLFSSKMYNDLLYDMENDK